MAVDWTEENLNLLRTLWREGKTAEKIATYIDGATKNAIVGKVNRLGLPQRRVGPAPSRRDANFNPMFMPNPNRKRKKAAAKAKPQSHLKAFGTPVKSLLDLKPKQCRWPLNDPQDDDFHFCAAEREGSGPYCKEHKACSLQSTAQPHNTEEEMPA
jgi:GcrA cell cycle regulator